MASTTTPKKCQNNEEINVKPSIENSCESATSPLGFKVEESEENIEREATEENICSSGSTTPKGERFRVPKVVLDDCPPAPEKNRSIMTDSSLSKEEVFASSAIDLFFADPKKVSTECKFNSKSL